MTVELETEALDIELTFIAEVARCVGTLSLLDPAFVLYDDRSVGSACGRSDDTDDDEAPAAAGVTETVAALGGGAASVGVVVVVIDTVDSSTPSLIEFIEGFLLLAPTPEPFRCTDLGPRSAAGLGSFRSQLARSMILLLLFTTPDLGIWVSCPASTDPFAIPL